MQTEPRDTIPASAESIAMDAPCLRDNECSQQQLIRLVGHRNPMPSSDAWDRLRRAQAAHADAGV